MVQSKLRSFVETWIAAEAILFAAAALAHAGVRLPMIHEPPILPAAIIEGVCALMLATAAREVHAGRFAARRAAIAAHGVAISAVLLGMLALYLQLAPSTAVSLAFYRGILALLLLAFALLTSPWAAPRRLRPAQQPSEAQPSEAMWPASG